MKAGRPTIYSEELANKICSEIADGRSLRSICFEKDMPCKSSVFSWIATNKDFKERYERACMERAEWLAEDLLEIADDGKNDWMENNDPDNPGYRANGEHINRSRLRVDTRKWIASKMYPKKYGDKVETTLKGDPSAPVTLVLNGSDVNG